nr:oleate hydratase [Sphingobacterium multivorum]
MDKEGNYIKKPMPQCTGDEILAELCHHLGIIDQLDDVIKIRLYVRHLCLTSPRCLCQEQKATVRESYLKDVKTWA